MGEKREAGDGEPAGKKGTGGWVSLPQSVRRSGKLTHKTSPPARLYPPPPPRTPHPHTPFQIHPIYLRVHNSILYNVREKAQVRLPCSFCLYSFSPCFSSTVTNLFFRFSWHHLIQNPINYSFPRCRLLVPDIPAV